MYRQIVYAYVRLYAHELLKIIKKKHSRCVRFLKNAFTQIRPQQQQQQIYFLHLTIAMCTGCSTLTDQHLGTCNLLSTVHAKLSYETSRKDFTFFTFLFDICCLL